jgi:acyl-CoA thioester hydrolase
MLRPEAVPRVRPDGRRTVGFLGGTVRTTVRWETASGARRPLPPSLDSADYPFVHSIRTRFAETDAMGIIHHAAYLLYLEEARVAYLRRLGHPYGEVRIDGINFAVLEVAVQYRRPLAFDDQVDVHLRVAAISGATFQLTYLLRVDHEVRATAVTVHGCVDANGKVHRLPVWLGQAFEMDRPSADASSSAGR